MTPNVTRRGFFRVGAAAGIALAGGAALSACGSSSSGAGTASGIPQSGGTLRAAFVGGGAAETLNFLKGPTPLDYIRARAQHGALGAIDPAAPDGVRYVILDGIDVAPDLTSYTLRLRSGLKFSDGSPVTAADVLYSLQAPTTLGALPYMLTPSRTFNLDAATVRDDRTLILPTVKPVVDGRLVLCQSTLVFKNGTTEFTPTTPSCGPFRLTQFEPGQGASFVRNDDWSIDGGTRLDGLELHSIPDGDARANALRGGQVDFVSDVSAVTARTLGADPKLAITTSEAPTLTRLSFSMNVTHPQFADNRVRTAFKLAADRTAMVGTALFGNGVVGNDLPSLGFPDYAADITQRQHDPTAARQLLSDAGATGMPISLVTGPESAGMVEVATMYVENLKDIGVAATLDQRPAGQLFSDPNYFSTPFAATYSPPTPLLSGYQTTLAGGAMSAFGYSNPRTDALFETARSATDPNVRTQASRDAQQLLWEDGNAVTPVFTKSIDAHTATVAGVVAAPYADFSGATVR